MATRSRVRHQVRERVLVDLPESNLGLRVRELRLRLVMSQQDIADALGVTASWVGHIETGQNQFASRERLWALAQVLQTDTLDLLIAAGYWKEPNVYSGIDPQLLNIARDSSPESQKMVVDLLRQINQAG